MQQKSPDSRFQTTALPDDRDAMAPDGSEVRLLVTGTRGSMAHFRLPAGRTSVAVAHRTVEEVWFVVAGRGEMWRGHGDHEEIVSLTPGVSVQIPVGTRFQFRSTGDAPLDIVGTTMPPWPGEDEAYVVEGAWVPSEGT